MTSTNPTLVFEDGTRYRGEAWKGLTWQKRTLRLMELRNRIVRKDIHEWTAEEMEIITTHSTLYSYKNGWVFEVFFGAIVFVNTMIMAFKVDDDEPDHAFYTYVEHFFCLFFFVEWCLQIYIEGPIWLLHAMNVFETALVWIGGVFPVWVMPIVGASGGFWSKVGGVFTIFRVLRIFRLYRLVRKTKQKDLWMLIVGVMVSFKSFVWAMVLFIAFMFVSSIFLRFVVGGDDVIMNSDTTGTLDRYLGSVPKTMWFLFACFTNGVSWEGVVHVVVVEAPHYWIYFAIFVCLGEFIMLNLITAVIVEHAIDNAHSHVEHEAQENEQERIKIIERVVDMFKECDQNGDGNVDRKEFIKMCSGRAMQRLQRLLQMDEEGKDLLGLFDLIDMDGSGYCSLEEYKNTLFKVLQPPRSKDMLTILMHAKRNEVQLNSMLEQANCGKALTDGQPSYRDSELLMAVKTLTQKVSIIDTITERMGAVEGQMSRISDDVRKAREELSDLRRLHSVPKFAPELAHGVTKPTPNTSAEPMPNQVLREGKSSSLEGCCSRT